VPALPSSVLEPLWVQVAALLPARHDGHPLGCHRPRIPGPHHRRYAHPGPGVGCGYRRIADASCSATGLCRRRDEWISAGVAEQLRRSVLAAYDRMLGLSLDHLAVDGCTTKAPCGGHTAGPSPVDRRKQGLKRSVAVEAGGIPLAAVPAPANHRVDRLLRPPWTPSPLPSRCRAAHGAAGRRLRLLALPQVLAARGMAGRIATRGVPAPIQADRRWVVERTRAWGNQDGKLRWCTERRRLAVESWLALASAVIVCGRLLRRAWTHYRWEGRSRRRP